MKKKCTGFICSDAFTLMRLSKCQKENKLKSTPLVCPHLVPDTEKNTKILYAYIYTFWEIGHFHYFCFSELKYLSKNFVKCSSYLAWVTHEYLCYVHIINYNHAGRGLKRQWQEKIWSLGLDLGKTERVGYWPPLSALPGRLAEIHPVSVSWNAFQLELRNLHFEAFRILHNICQGLV